MDGEPPSFNLKPLFLTKDGYAAAWAKLTSNQAEMFGDYTAPVPVIEEQILKAIEEHEQEDYKSGKLNLVEESIKAGLGKRKVHDFKFRHGQCPTVVKQALTVSLLGIFVIEESLQDQYPYWKENGVMLDLICRYPFVVQFTAWLLKARCISQAKQVRKTIGEIDKKINHEKLTDEDREKLIKTGNELAKDQEWVEKTIDVASKLEQWSRYCMKRWWGPSMVNRYSALEKKDLGTYVDPDENMAKNVQARFFINVGMNEKARLKDELIKNRRLPQGEDILYDPIYVVKMITSYRNWCKFLSCALSIPFAFDMGACYNAVDPETGNAYYKPLDVDHLPVPILHWHETIKAAGLISNSDFQMQHKEGIFQQIAFPLMCISFAQNYYVPDLMYRQALDLQIKQRNEKLLKWIEEDKTIDEMNAVFDRFKTIYNEQKTQEIIERAKRQAEEAKELG